MYEYGNLNTLNIDDVLPNRFQPRIHFDEHKLNELAESIRKYGVIQPIVVRQIGDKYEIIAGERRYKASKIANKSTIPAIVINLNDKESEEIALLENVQRQNLTPIEEAVSYKRILDMGYITQVELAEKLGKTQSTIANKVRLLNLDDQVQYALLNGKISERHARSLLRLSDRAKQVEMLNKIINERLTVKKTDEAIQKLLEEPKEEQIQKVIIEQPIIEEKEPVVAEVKKKPFIKSEPVEELFTSDELIKKPRRAVPRGSHEIIRVSLPKEIEEKLMRKEEKGMDIDKIMREAQDINVPEENKDISNLMTQDSNVVQMSTPVVEPMVSEPAPQPEPEIPLVNDEQNKFVNFSGIVQEEPKQPEPVIENNINNNEAIFDNIFNQMPTNLQSNPQPSVEIPTPAIEPMVSEPVIENNSNIQTGSNAGTVSQEGLSIAEAVQQAMNSKLPEESAVETEIKASSPVSTPIIEPIQPKTLINENQGLYNELVQNELPSMVNQNEVQSGTVNQAPLDFNYMPKAEEYTEQKVEPIMPVQQNPQPSVEIPTPAVEPVITNIPDSDIIETAPTMNSNIRTSAVIEPKNENNFIEVIRLIRNCANEIEKLGYKIDVDEIDLGNIYQANFKINKD